MLQSTVIDCEIFSVADRVSMQMELLTEAERKLIQDQAVDAFSDLWRYIQRVYVGEVLTLLSEGEGFAAIAHFLVDGAEVVLTNRGAEFELHFVRAGGKIVWVAFSRLQRVH